MQAAYYGLGLSLGDFPVSEKISECVLSLPMHPYLDLDAIEKVVIGLKGS